MRVFVCLLALLTTLLSGCERPFMDSVQRGYRGTGMLQVYNPRIVEAKLDNNTAPVPLPAAPADGPKASLVFKNVKVLGDLSVAQFTRIMASMVTWVAPNEGCTYCHDAANFADDSKYTKVVARRMLEMTRTVNSQWKTHVAGTGITCYTCHRGNAIPQQVWYRSNPQPYGSNFMGDKAGQNSPDPAVNLSSLPNDPFTPFLLDAQDIRVNGPTPLPSGNRHSIKQAEWTYGLMTHLSQSLGVNCTYCHNSRSFQGWEGNPPQRAVAWYGIRMARALNNDYLEPLADTFPAHRKGELGDVAKANCATCHQGAYKPLNGTPMAADYPELVGPLVETVAAK
ncbi:photosynthetic reaction center cytochrome c subunit [Rhodoferax lacus]|uniref:Photosynthetic reaction center cytochrome c subunit n=1 Tax=Rhodoferax lacus TaxID=2184758 RepID=A0A3E1RDC4_9BURK|nr:photosynthetic reaction center cytochrome PufC [Rhodoferax lacus]RFO97022.1 photosynthetic reaction center cytochrome c subunit [Rhodoferax lacus]